MKKEVEEMKSKYKKKMIIYKKEKEEYKINLKNILIKDSDSSCEIDSKKRKKSKNKRISSEKLDI